MGLDLERDSNPDGRMSSFRIGGPVIATANVWHLPNDAAVNNTSGLAGRKQ